MNEDVFKYPKANRVELEALDGKVLVTPLLSVRYEDGIFAYFENAEYPQKGMSSPEIMIAVGIVKAIFIGAFQLRLSIVGVLSVFNRIGNKALEQYFLKDEYRTADAKELDRIVSDFIFKVTSNEVVAGQFSQIFSHLISFDNAYRLRFVDIASETSKKALLGHPRAEIQRLLGVLAKREVLLGKDVSDKFKKIANILSFLLWIPKYRKAFKYAIERSNWDNMIYDDIDKYWACLRTDYDFMGMSYTERMGLLKAYGYSLPVQKEMKI